MSVNNGSGEFLVLLFLIVAIFLVVLVLHKVFRPVMGGTKMCPRCAETIKAEAKVCRFCGRDV